MDSKTASFLLLAMVCVSLVEQIRSDLVKGVLLGAMIAKQRRGDKVIVLPMHGNEWHRPNDHNESDDSDTTPNTDLGDYDYDIGHHAVMLPLMRHKTSTSSPTSTAGPTSEPTTTSTIAPTTTSTIAPTTTSTIAPTTTTTAPTTVPSTTRRTTKGGKHWSNWHYWD